jgi:hypothetical protein
MTEDWVLQCCGKVTSCDPARRILAIGLALAPVWKDSVELRAVLSGLEEEQVPALCSVCSGDAAPMAAAAARASAVSVGVALGADGRIALHHARLPEATPLQVIDVSDGLTACRVLGTNAARLAKGVPLHVGAA